MCVHGVSECFSVCLGECYVCMNVKFSFHESCVHSSCTLCEIKTKKKERATRGNKKQHLRRRWRAQARCRTKKEGQAAVLAGPSRWSSLAGLLSPGFTWVFVESALFFADKHISGVIWVTKAVWLGDCVWWRCVALL